MREMIDQMIDEKVEEKMKEHNEKLAALQKKLEQAQQPQNRRPMTAKPLPNDRNGAKPNKPADDEDDGTPSNSRPSIKKVVASKINTGTPKLRSESKDAAQNKSE